MSHAQLPGFFEAGLDQRAPDAVTLMPGPYSERFNLRQIVPPDDVQRDTTQQSVLPFCENPKIPDVFVDFVK